MQSHSTQSTKLPITLVGLLFLACKPAMGDEIRIAVASNFIDAMKQVSKLFEQETGHSVKLIFGSTGKQYAQIRNGAPFDLFFAADSRRPKMLEEEGSAQPDSRFTYALGKIVLWSPKADFIDDDGKVLESDRFRHLAVANPKLAPYGKAAQEVLEKRGLWHALRGRMVRGENIGQTYQFVKSGNAELGFVAYSQVSRPGHAMQGSYWKVAQSLYTPIEQQAVLIREGEAAREFLDFVKQTPTLDIIRSFGYGTP